ncbi:MAG: hypothetical protein WAK31_04250 [Chthoniobacterales bacterium]
MKTVKHVGSFKPRLLAIGLAIFAGATWVVNSPLVSAGPQQTTPEKPAVTNGLSGATLYAINCSRCHQERYPKEFTAAQWKTIMIHMRVRANLPAAQAREIMKYLQDEAGN